MFSITKTQTFQFNILKNNTEVINPSNKHLGNGRISISNKITNLHVCIDSKQKYN